MSHPAPILPRARRARGISIAALTAALLAMASVFATIGAPNAGATVTPDVRLVAGYLATQVGADGSVVSPYTSLPSVEATMDVALALAEAGTQPVALGAALAYVEQHATSYVTEVGMNHTGRFAYLIMLAVATGRDPRAFGTDHVDLVAGLQALHGSFEPGMYGPSNPYYAVATQGLAILALDAAHATIPADAITWLEQQQCGVGNNSSGGWQAYRAPSGAGRAACDVSDGSLGSGSDSNNTAFAIQALAAVGHTSSFATATAWLHTDNPIGGGFGWYVGDAHDPSSTALVMQALVAMGEHPDDGTWTRSSITPTQSLASWIIRSGADTGAMASNYSAGAADLFSTYQGVWGLALQPFPLVPVTVVDPTTTAPTTSTTEAPSPIAPSFTG